MRLQNEENAGRYSRCISYLQQVAANIEGAVALPIDESEGAKDGIVYLMLPEACVISKPTMHSIYSACFAADETSYTSSRNPRFRFVIRDVWKDGKPLEEL